MAKYVVFAGSGGGSMDFQRALGYIESLLDQRVLEGTITAGEVWKREDIDHLFFMDEKVKSILQGFEPELPKRYTVIGVKVIDEKKLEKIIPCFEDRFEYTHHAIYDL